jgi:hypothetical protein
MRFIQWSEERANDFVPALVKLLGDESPVLRRDAPERAARSRSGWQRSRRRWRGAGAIGSGQTISRG